VPESRRGLRIAVVVLRVLTVVAAVFALSGAGSLMSQVVRGNRVVVPMLVWVFFVGVAAAAVFFVLSEAGAILARLEEQGEYFRERLEQMTSGAERKRDKESD